MRNHLGTCYIGRNAKGDRFVLLKLARDQKRGIHFLIGPIIPIPISDMEQNGMFLVLNEVRNVRCLDPERLSAAETINDKELLSLKRNHVLISVELLIGEIEEIKLIPLHAGRGWRFDRVAEEVRFFRLPTSNGEFLQHLNEALDVAS